MLCSLTSGLAAQLRIVSPNGGESLRVGSKVTIIWTGVLPTDVITLEYSTDNGASWNPITNTAKGLQYTWLNIPNTVSATCLLRATFQTATPATLRLFGSGNFGNADFSSDGNLVISGSADGNAYIWDSHSAQLIHQYRTESGAGITLKALNSWGTFNPDMKTFATVSPTPDGPSNGNVARIFDAATGAKLHEWILLDPSNLAYATGHCQFSPDGTRLAVTGEDSIRVFDVTSESVIAKLAGFVRADGIYTEYNIANCMDWRPDGSDVIGGIAIKSDSIPTYIRASATTGDTLQSYRLRSSYPHVSVNTGVHYSPDGSLFIASTQDTSARVWNVATGAILFTIRPGLWESVDAVFSHDGKTIATLGYDSLGFNSYNVKLWNASDGSFIRWVGTLGFGSGTIEFSPDDARILVSSSGNNIIFQVAQTGLESDVSDGVWSIVPNTGQNVVVYTPDASANVNDLIDIPVFIDDPGGAVAAGASSVSFDLHFNETMLEPIGTTPKGTVTGSDRVLHFNLPIVATDTVLTMLHFRVALGDDSVTSLAVAKPLTNSLVVTASNNDGTFKLLNVCTAGGPRLLNPDGVVAMSVPNNPVHDAIQVKVNLIEDGHTSLTLFDACGRAAATIVDDYLTHGTQLFSVPASGIGSGVYYVILQTPNNRLMAPVEVEK